MHRSQLGGFIIDCKGGDLDAAADFWGKALGLPAERMADPEEDAYRRLDSGVDGLHIEVQRVSHSSRVHLDIETDNIEAEVKRLQKLGAKTIGHVKTWCVMEAPTGHRFCVVKAGRANFRKSANEW